MRTLYGLTQSPWTEKARWALDHHAVAYRYHEHVPVLGEVLLRVKARSRPPGTRPSVPLLVDGREVLCSSLSIARHADLLGGRGARPLFPAGRGEEVEHWAAVSDRIIEAGRARVFVGLRTSRAAQREALPPLIPGPLRSALSPVAVTAVLFLGAKYRVSRDADAEAERVMRPALEQVREALGGRAHLLGELTFADIAVAASLQALVARERAPIGPATRAIWANPGLARDYPDLLEWRDRVYAESRPGG